MPTLNETQVNSLISYLRTSHLEAGHTLALANDVGSHFFLGRVLFSNAHVAPNQAVLSDLMPELEIADMALFRPVNPNVADVSLAVIHNAPRNQLGFNFEKYTPTITTYFILNPMLSDADANWFKEIDLVSPTDAMPLRFHCPDTHMPNGLSGAPVFKAFYYEKKTAYWRIEPAGIVYGKTIIDDHDTLLAINADAELKTVYGLMISKESDDREQAMNEARQKLGMDTLPIVPAFAQMATGYQSGTLGEAYDAFPATNLLRTGKYRKILCLQDSLLISDAFKHKKRFKGIDMDALKEGFNDVIQALCAQSTNNQFILSTLKPINDRQLFRMDIQNNSESISLCFEDNTGQRAQGDSAQFLHVKIDLILEKIPVAMFFEAAKICACYLFPVHISATQPTRIQPLKDDHRNGNIFSGPNGLWDQNQVARLTPFPRNATLAVVEQSQQWWNNPNRSP